MRFSVVLSGRGREFSLHRQSVQLTIASQPKGVGWEKLLRAV